MSYESDSFTKSADSREGGKMADSKKKYIKELPNPILIDKYLRSNSIM